MTIINHIANKHYAKLKDVLFLYRNTNRVFIQLLFTEDSKYILDTADQGDWNKVIGKASWHRFFSFIKSIYSKRRETFITWRYYPDKNLFEVGQYYRVGDEHFTNKTWFVKANELIIVKMDFFKDNISVGGYFGGHDTDNNGIGGVAPKDLSYKVQFI